MKVSLRTADEVSGIFRKTTEYALYVKTELTPDECNAVKRAGIDDYLLMEYSYKGSNLDWTVRSVVYSSDKASERRFVASDAVARSVMEQCIIEKLKALKSQIEGLMNGGIGTKSFDL